MTLTLQYDEDKLVKVHKISTQVKKKNEELPENNCLKFEEIESYGKSLNLGKKSVHSFILFQWIVDSSFNTELCFTEKMIYENRESEANLN